MWTHELKVLIETRHVGATALRHSKHPNVERLGLRGINVDAPKMLENCCFHGSTHHLALIIIMTASFPFALASLHFHKVHCIFRVICFVTPLEIQNELNGFKTNVSIVCLSNLMVFLNSCAQITFHLLHVPA
jgi:hypothetical protein